MAADVSVENITSDRFSYEHGKVLHLSLKPANDSEKIIMEVDGKEFFSTDLKFQCHANLLLVKHNHYVEPHRFELILPKHSFVKIEITEAAYNSLSTAIQENSSRYEEEQREARRALFFNRMNDLNGSKDK